MDKETKRCKKCEVEKALNEFRYHMLTVVYELMVVKVFFDLVQSFNPVIDPLFIRSRYAIQDYFASAVCILCSFFRHP